MTDHPETIEHDGRTYRLVPDEAEVARAREVAEAESALQAADRFSGGFVSPHLQPRELSTHLALTTTRLLAAILREVRR